MNEKEFDIYVRNLLQNAEEDVSPSVWKGVEAGLSKPRRAVVPFWRRVAVSVILTLLYPLPPSPR